MLGNLFNQKRPGKSDDATPQPVPPVPANQAFIPQASGVVNQQVAPGLIGSKMNPALRQNLSALSHLDARSTQVLQHAQQEAAKVRQQHIEPEHLLLGLLYDDGIFKVFEEFAVDITKLTQELQSKQQVGAYMGQPTLSNTTQQIFEQAYRDAKKRGANFVTPEDLLVVLLEGNIQTSAFLQQQGLKKEQVIEKFSKNSEYSTGKKSVLETYGVDLTEEAKLGKLDPITGRDKEIERLVHILLRRTKNNPVIIGEAGVGKTAIIEGVAQQIVSGNVPRDLQGKRIIQLDLSSLVAGASHRGEFEERLRSVIKEAMASSGQIILFVDEIHTVMGAGDEGGAMDASNIIKPHLARGHLQIIGTTTTTEYRKHFEKDKAFERRFQPIMCEEPDEENAMKMLQILKPKYEKFHNVVITDEAIEAAVKLSKKYIGERYLPDKAVDLLDEAAAEVKLAHGGESARPDDSSKFKIQSSKLDESAEDQHAVDQNSSAGSASKDVARLDANGQPGKAPSTSSGQAQGGQAGQVVGQQSGGIGNNTDSGQVIQPAGDQQQAKNEEMKATPLRPVPEAVQGSEGQAEETKVSSDTNATKEGDATPSEPRVARADNQVKKSDIENVVSSWTGIPITKLTEDEGQKLLKLEERVHQRLIDQEEAVVAVSEAVRRGRIGLAAANRPIASFIFLGPTGTGKTELAKTLAEILFGRDDAMVRLDMSEYMEKHEVAKLIGAPPGYVGYEEGGQLTEAVRAKPYSIVLLDEVEKAHPDVFNILLQLLEDGRLTDNKGNTISFRNTIVICTSNIGSQAISQKLSEQSAGGGKKTKEQFEKEFKELSGIVQDELRKFFRPELLNRFDDTVIFKPLRPEHMHEIARLGIKKTGDLLKEQGYTLDITEKAVSQLAVEGYDAVYGARPLRRLIQSSIENPIALLLISKKFAPGDTILIDYDADKNEYTFNKGEVKTEEAEGTKRTHSTSSGQAEEIKGVEIGQTQDGTQPQVPGGAGQAQQLPTDPTATSGQVINTSTDPLNPSQMQAATGVPPFGAAQGVPQGGMPDSNVMAMINGQNQAMGMTPEQAAVPQAPTVPNGMIQPSFDVTQVIDPQQMTPPPPTAGTGVGIPMSSSFASALANLKENES